MSEEEELEAALRAAVGQALGTEVSVNGLERLTGGASRETWAFEASEAGGARHPLILRRDFPGGQTHNPDAMAGCSDVLDRAGEFALQQALYEADVPVPRPVCRPQGIENSFVMQHVAGESRPRALARAEEYREQGLARQVGAALARLHAVEQRSLPQLPERPLDVHLELCRSLMDLGPAPRPALEFALRWLRDNRPPGDEGELRPVHGDFRNGNLIVGDQGLSAVIDFEYAHLGDPMEDVAFVCLRPWRFGSRSHEVGGFGTREELYAGYEQGGGGPIDPAAVHYWEVAGGLKWAALCVVRGVEHLRGVQRSVELAAIGRRVVESEYDLLALVA